MAKEAKQSAAYVGGNPYADHLCVLVHGLWGNPDHMKNIARILRSSHTPDKLYMLLAKRNSGSFTYDGIELGGERVCAEIEDELQNIEARGGKIKKLSIVGYSLGGLVSGYAVGLLYAKGLLEDIECMGLRKFKRHTLYANIVNDRSAVYYTTCIQKTDPYHQNLDKINVNYVQGCEGVILDPNVPLVPQPTLPLDSGRRLSSVMSTALRWTKQMPFYVVIALVVSVGTVAFFGNAVIQTIRSASRIRKHESGQTSLDISEYRVPLLIKDVRVQVESAYEVLNNSQNQQYLEADDEDNNAELDNDVELDMRPEQMSVKNMERLSTPAQSTLALTPDQFEMIRSLDTLKWRKYPVWIHRNRHSHAAIIVRMEKPTFDEGYVVLRHFADAEFLM